MVRGRIAGVGEMLPVETCRAALFCRIVALAKPTERERTQWYFQRYIANLPSAGEIVLFDRSWYNRAGVEKVLGFCTPEEHRRFLRQVPIFERLLIEDGIVLLKYWFSVSDEEQERRFRSRIPRSRARASSGACPASARNARSRSLTSVGRSPRASLASSATSQAS